MLSKWIKAQVFILCVLLDDVKLQLGFALGLFAIFGIIRYRTDPIPIKEMTYLFLVIGVSVVNALANKKISYAELLFANLSSNPDSLANCAAIDFLGLDQSFNALFNISKRRAADVIFLFLRGSG